ncbi:hypothetical protein Q5752_006553 [Cryptotrichosporon argae]
MARDYDVHHRYADTTADFSLASSDGVRFYVHSYYLMAASLLFRDTFSDPALRLSSDSILIDYPASALVAFLALVTGETPVLNILEAHTLVAMLDKYQCTPLRPRLAYALLPLRQGHPWEVFCIASWLDEPELAKAAVGHMRRDEAYWKDETRARADPRFLAGLQRATSAVARMGSSMRTHEYGVHRAKAFRPLEEDEMGAEAAAAAPTGAPVGEAEDSENEGWTTLGKESGGRTSPIRKKPRRSC